MHFGEAVTYYTGRNAMSRNPIITGMSDIAFVISSDIPDVGGRGSGSFQVRC